MGNGPIDRRFNYVFGKAARRTRRQEGLEPRLGGRYVEDRCWRRGGQEENTEEERSPPEMKR